jgi:phage-related protein
MELFELNGRVVVNLGDALKAFDEINKEGQKSQSKLSKAFSAVGRGAAVAGKAIMTGLAAGGAAMGALTIKALNLSGELEQNMGGSEQVFKEYAEKMQETARTAFENMGLSTSDFLGTANKMGALFQGAGFTIEESSNLAAEAMQRAADVASIMGIDTGAAMEAIAGAAKGNFTMMDNLGVAMNDTAIGAYALSKGIDKATKDMTQQEKIGLAMEMFLEKTAYAAGNYARENETLAGALGTAKAALTNFLDGSGDTTQLVDSFKNAADVIVKNVKEIAPRLIIGIRDIVTQVSPMIPELIGELLPMITYGAIGLINGLVSAAPKLVSSLMGMLPSLISGVGTMISGLVSALPQIIQTLVSGIASQAPALLTGVGQLITGIADFIQTNLPLITEKAKDMVAGLSQKIKENLPVLISKGLDILMGLSESILTNLPQLVATGMDLLMSLVQGIVSALPELIAKAPQIIINFANSISGSMQTIFSKGFEIIWELIKGIIGAIPDLIANFPKVIEAIFAVWNAINWLNLGKNLINGIKNGITKMGTGLKNTASNLFNKLHTSISNIFKAIGNAIMHPINTAKTLFSGVVSAIKAIATGNFGALKSSVTTIFNAIKSAITNPLQTAKTIVKGVIDAITGFFNFKIKWPEIPMPKFAVSPSGWKIGDLLKGSIPKLSIQWHADAMRNPMIMNSPTVFGYNPATGTLMGGGEAGSEVVSGTATLLNLIQQAVRGENSGLAQRLDRIITLLIQFFPDALEAMKTPMMFDTNGAVLAMAPAMNAALGKIAIQKGRGR